jgi:hypothetical protein
MIRLWGRSGKNRIVFVYLPPSRLPDIRNEVSEQAEGAAALVFVYIRPSRLPYIKNEVSGRNGRSRSRTAALRTFLFT